MRKNKILILLLLLIVASILVSVSFAYWPNLFTDYIKSEINLNDKVTIGTWSFEDDTPIFSGNGSVRFNDELIIKDGENNKKLVSINDIFIESFNSAIVIKYLAVDSYGNSTTRYFIMNNAAKAYKMYETPPFPYPDKSDKFRLEHAYKHTEIEYYPNIFYVNGDVVSYQGKFYRVNNNGIANNEVPKDIKFQGWEGWQRIDDQYDSSKFYNKGYVVIADNKAYIALKNIDPNGKHPSEAVGAWNRYGTLDFVLNNTYQYNDIVLDSSDGIFYRLYGQTSQGLIPSKNPSLWIRADLPNP